MTNQDEKYEDDTHVHPFFQLRSLEERRRKEKSIQKPDTETGEQKAEQHNLDPPE